MSAETTTCVICSKQRGEPPTPGGPLYMDEWVASYHADWQVGQPDQYLGWVTLETRRHIPKLWDLNAEESAAVGRLIPRLSRALRDVVGAEHVYLFVIGHGVDHVHLHLIARYPGAPREYWGPKVDEWPDAPRGGEEAIAALCARLRKALGE